MKGFFSNKNLKGNPFLCWIELLVLLLALWFIMSGIFEAKFIGYGSLTAIVVSLMCLNTFTMDGLKTSNQYFLLNVNYLKFIAYFFWLIKEIIVCALTVSKQVLNGKINPQIVWFKADYDNPAARALLANSITLTPGTVTIDISDDGVFSVHALDDGAAEGLLAGGMQKKIADLYGETIDLRPLTTVEVPDRSRETSRLVTKTYRGRRARL